MEDNGGVQGETVSSYPIVCCPSAGNVKNIYSLVLAFACHIEMQPVSSEGVVQRGLSSDGDGTDVATTGSERRPPTVASLRESKNGTGPTSIVQGLRGAIFAMGAQKLLPKNFIDRLYLPNAEVELRQPIVLAVSSPDALTAVISQHTQRELGLQRPILSVAYLTNHALGETKAMAMSLPDYAAKCAKIGLSVLETFLNWASSIYKSISVSESNGATIPSAEWARDNDLSRFWTNFPVWQRMMAADAFATVNTAHNVGNPHDAQLGSGANSSKSTIFGDPCQPSTPGSSLSSAAAIVLGLSNLGLNGRTDPTFTGGASLRAIPFANSVGQDSGVESDRADGGISGVAVSNGGISKQEDISEMAISAVGYFQLLHEREATRLAVKEMDNLLHIIGDEVGSSTDFCLPTADMLTIKSMGRLRESVHWLERCVQNWLVWLEGNVSGLDMVPFATAAEELTSLSDATLLTVYLDVRVQAYNLFGNLPRTANFWCPVDEVDVDSEVTRCLIYWDQLQEVLIHSFCPHEIRFIFDGLGDFISQIFLRLIPQITRMNVNGNRKMCRNIYKLQQALALLTENHESDLIRVKQLYELFYLNPEAVVNRVIEQGVAFEVGVYQNLLRLYQRSHPSHDHSRTDDSITKLAQIIRA
ncbi:Exocyst complex component 4 [Taenia solium]|eukprot:TsM_000171500 transcript=TsM_000171500 gene=TsM_000171500